MKSKEEARIRIIVFCSMAPVVAMVVIVLLSLIIPLFEPDVDPLDASPNKTPRIIAEEIVVDSTSNGFRVVYATAKDVTQARYEELVSRRHIKDSLAHLKRDAPLYFGNMLYADIYDFTLFALSYHPDPDIVLHNVFVFGREKQDLYLGPNPNIDNPAQWINNGTLQGILYINREDILRCTSSSKRVYRYWRCRIPFNRSDTDEHFSHFSEDERLY